MITESDTCRKYVLPRLYDAGWSDDQIAQGKAGISNPWPQGLWPGEPPNGIRRLNLKRPLRACDPVPEGTFQLKPGISNPWPKECKQQ